MGKDEYVRAVIKTIRARLLSDIYKGFSDNWFIWVERNSTRAANEHYDYQESQVAIGRQSELQLRPLSSW